VALCRVSCGVRDLCGRLSGVRFLGFHVRHGSGQGDAAAIDGL
jgi:hypothetical protein